MRLTRPRARLCKLEYRNKISPAVNRPRARIDPGLGGASPCRECLRRAVKAALAASRFSPRKIISRNATPSITLNFNGLLARLYGRLPPSPEARFRAIFRAAVFTRVEAAILHRDWGERRFLMAGRVGFLGGRRLTGTAGMRWRLE